MNRRHFLGTLLGGVAANAAVRTWPFRVYSFPTEIVLPKRELEIETTWYSPEGKKMQVGRFRIMVPVDTDPVHYVSFGHVKTLHLEKLNRLLIEAPASSMALTAFHAVEQ